MTAFFTFIRWKNILITGVYQYILYFYLIIPSFIAVGLTPQLDLHLIILFIMCTICIAASANIINDLSDIETDKINKPESPLISGKIAMKTGWILYYTFVTAGFTAAFYIAWKIGKLHLTGIYIVMQVLMYLYSKKFKYKGLPGNITVALSIAFVSLIMLWSEPQILSNPLLKNCKIIIIGFSFFVFFINLSRELIKDIEDIEGDKISGLTTLPITSGIANTKWLSSISLLILVILLILWVLLNKNLDFRLQAFPLVILAGPIILSIFRIYKAEVKIHYTKISKLLKYIMLLGLIYLFLIIQHNHL